MKTTTQELLAPYANWLATQTAENRIYGTTALVAMLHAEARHVAKIRNSRPTPFGGWKNKLPLEHCTLLGRCFKQIRTDGKLIDAPGMREALQSADEEIYKTAHGLMASGRYVDDIEWWKMTSDQLVEHCWSHSDDDI